MLHLHREFWTVPDTKKSSDKQYKLTATLIGMYYLSKLIHFWLSTFTCYSKKSDENLIMSNDDRETDLQSLYFKLN